MFSKGVLNYLYKFNTANYFAVYKGEILTTKDGKTVYKNKGTLERSIKNNIASSISAYSDYGCEEVEVKNMAEKMFNDQVKSGNLRILNMKDLLNG